MPMVVAHNLNALSTTRNLSLNNSSMAKSLEKLSSGYRINNGSDDPSGLVISEQLRAQNAGLKRAVQNTQEANNVLGIAEGALNEMNNILKKMRQLAIHSANNGVTSPEQIAADQAEIDSSVQTMDRIARTTKFSDQYLLNGNKELNFDRSTIVTDPMDMHLLDLDMTDIEQVFKRENFALNVNFSNDDEGSKEAQKAYLEIDPAGVAGTQVNGNYELTADQSFTITGNQGSRQYSFAKDTHIGEMVETINSSSAYTGVKSTLIFDSNVQSTQAGGAINNNINLTGDPRTAGEMDFFTRDANGNIVTDGGITAIGLTADAAGAASGASLYAYAYGSTGDTFNAAGTSSTIKMQFEKIDNTTLPDNNTVYLQVVGGAIEAYSDAAYTNNIGTAVVDGTGKYTIDFGGGSKMYLGFDSVTPGATTKNPTTTATRPFAGNLSWFTTNKTIQYSTITGTQSTDSFFGTGMGNTIGIDAAGIAAKFNLTGGDAAETVAAIEWNIQQAMNEWEAALTGTGITFADNAAYDGTSGADPMGATLGMENGIRIGMVAIEEGASGTPTGVAGIGGLTGDSRNIYGNFIFDANDNWAIKKNIAGDTINAEAKVGSDGQAFISFYDVVMHELGHVMGFAHPADLYGANGMMSYNNPMPNIPYTGAPGTGTMYDGSWTDTYMEDAINQFYLAGKTVNTVTINPLVNGDKLTVQLTQGPANSGIGAMAAADFSNMETIGNVAASSLISEGYNVDLMSAGGLAANNVQALGGIAEASLHPTTGIVPGYNTDGFGRVYLKMDDADNYTVYKDIGQTMKVGEGVFDAGGNSTMRALNNSGLDNLIALTKDASMVAGYTAVIQLDYMHEDDGTRTQGVNISDLSANMNTAGVGLDFNGSFMSGIKLGENTAANGSTFLSVKSANSGTDCVVSMYKDSRMRAEDLVAQSATGLDLSGAVVAVRLFATENPANGTDSGMYATFNIGGTTLDGTVSGEISATSLAARISSEDYGADEFVKIDAHRGAIWNYAEGNNTELLDAGLIGKSHTSYGQNATVSINGQELQLDGLSGKLSSTDITAELAFNEGYVGNSTIAAVGYDIGTFATRAGMMDYDDTDPTNLVVHSVHSVTDKLDNFTGGMQFQLGEGAGDQERTIYSLSNMTATELGKTTFNDFFGGNTKSDMTLSINDLLSGGAAALGTDPVKSLSIIDAAIRDVANTRASIGAFQANMLETNSNSLSVAIENITKTESFIRDADMANESTAFSKNQIMVQAGTSMLAQANGLSQNILSLIS